MDSPSLNISNQNAKQNLSNVTRDNSEYMNLSSGREIKSQIISPNKAHIRYDQIPMAKPVPQWNKSAATLRNSPSFHRFNKNARFSQPKCNYQDAQTFDIPTTLNKRASSFGFGERVSIPEIFSSGVSSATKLCPFYYVDSDRHKRSNSAVSLREGKTFGISWKKYEATRTPHRSSVHSSQQVKANPGPNYYSLNPEGKNNARKAKMHERLPMFTSANGNYRLNEPHPQSYDLKEELMKKNHRAAGVGFGKKTDFTKQRQKSPGPIYKLSGFTDKFTHIKMKLKET